MRTFLGFPLENAELKDKIISFQKNSQKKAIKGKIKWVEEENLHLTLKFLGETSPSQIKEIDKTIDNLKFESFNLVFNRWGFFPNNNSPKVFWLGFQNDENYQKIVSLSKIIDKKLEKIGFKREKRKYHPHLTLARIKFLKGIDERNLEKFFQNIKISKLVLPISKINFYESILTQTGPIYSVIKSYPLI